MPIQIIEYTNPLDALIALVKKLDRYEIEYKLDSDEFYQRYRSGEIDDDETFIEWANDYQHYRALHDELSIKLEYVA
jgi:hypothetical protein